MTAPTTMPAGLVDGRLLDRNRTVSADAVIVGSGAGGAPMAHDLAKAGWRVVLLEEGHAWSPGDLRGDPIQAMRDLYRDGGLTATLGAPPIPLPLGIGLGGTTLINSGTCFRLPEDVFAQWKSKFGLGNLHYNDLVPHFETVETMLQVAPTQWSEMGANNQLLAKGAAALGYSGHPLLGNRTGCKGAGACVWGCPNGAKRSTNLNYVPAAIAHGATVFTSTRASRVILSPQGDAAGIEAVMLDNQREPRGALRVEAPVVVLACGAIGTPEFLLRQGLANRSGQVGNHLRLHPCAKVVAVFDEAVESWRGVPQAYVVDQFADEGILIEGFWVPPGLLAVAMPVFGERLMQLMQRYPNMAGVGVMVSDSSAGRVRPGIGGRPLIRYQINRTDTAALAKGIAHASEIYLAAGAREIYLPIHGAPVVKCAADLHAAALESLVAGNIELVAFHPMGTCRMGDDPKNSVVDATLQCHDVAGLFVVDASVFPSSLGVNPQVSIMAFSHLAASALIQRSGGRKPS